MISASLHPHQGVITADSGHINLHGSEGNEDTGQKVLALPSADGKLTFEQVQVACDEHFNDDIYEHMVQPKLVYISNLTEIGSIYSRSELAAIRGTCLKNHLFFTWTVRG